MFILSISENILLLISGLGILQGILLAALIYFHPKSDRSVSTFLALHILFISFAMTMPFTIHFITWQRGNLMQPVILLPAIFLYLYAKSFKERISFKKLLPHIFTFFLFFVAVFWNTSSISTRYTNVKVPPEEVFHETFNIVIPVIQIMLKIFYYFLARQALISYQQSIQQLFSETSRINLIWAKTLVNSYLFLVLAGIVIFVLMMRYPQHFNLLLLINVLIGTPYIYFATYKGIAQPTIWQLQPGKNKEYIEKEIGAVQEMQSIKKEEPENHAAIRGLSEDKAREINARILVLMEKDKLYQEPELTLQDLSDKLTIPSHQVSLAINEGMKKSFYDLVNGYRVEEAKRLLLDIKNTNFTILSLGFEAGFNSKTTFNTVFKKFTGFTPTEFRIKQKAPELV